MLNAIQSAEASAVATLNHAAAQLEQLGTAALDEARARLDAAASGVKARLADALTHLDATLADVLASVGQTARQVEQRLAAAPVPAPAADEGDTLLDLRDQTAEAPASPPTVPPAAEAPVASEPAPTSTPVSPADDDFEIPLSDPAPYPAQPAEAGTTVVAVAACSPVAQPQAEPAFDATPPVPVAGATEPASASASPEQAGSRPKAARRPRRSHSAP